MNAETRGQPLSGGESADKSGLGGEGYEHILRISQFWLGVGTQPAIVVLPALEAKQILTALHEGKTCHWGEWTLRSAPTRKSVIATGEIEWDLSLLVSSIHGFTTFGGIDAQHVLDACKYINRREREIKQQRAIADHWERRDQEAA
jgi:hypothetical protein